MPSATATRLTARRGSLVGGVAVGLILVTAGLAIAYLTIGTPVVAGLVSGGGSSGMGVALGVWAFALIAGGALVVAGTDHLAAGVRTRFRPKTPFARAMAGHPSESIILADVTSTAGRPIPEVVIGPHGVAVAHELPKPDRIRRLGSGWEVRTSDGWRPAEDPLDAAARDAERIRHWLGHGELDFVVRVYAVLIAPEGSLPRTPTCAVVSPDQVPAWLAALPPQRSLTPARRGRIQAMLQGGRGYDGSPEWW